MGKQPGPRTRVMLLSDAAEYVLKRYLAVTIIRFTPEMGARLVVARKRMNITQRELADKLGITQTDISRIEAGKKVNALPNSDVFKTVLDKYFVFVLFGGVLLAENDVTIEEQRYTKWWGAKLKR